MSSSHAPTAQIEALDAFAQATATGTAYAQLLAAREVDAATCCLSDHGLSYRRRALLFEAQTLLAMTDMRFSDAIEFSQESAGSWRGAGKHANELAMQMAEVTAKIGEVHRDTIAVVPLTAKLEHLLAALVSAEPTRRQLVEGTLECGFANLAVDRLTTAGDLFARALQVSGDDIERTRAIGASALCELQAGNERAARALATKAIALARSIDDDLQLATLLRFMAGIHAAADEPTEALEVAEESADLAEKLGEVQYASTLRLRGMLRVANTRTLEGCADMERAIVLLRNSAWTHTIPAEVLTLAQTLVGIGEHAKAEHVLREHAPFLDKTAGDERAEIDVLRYSVAIRGGDHARAGAYAENVGGLLAAAHHKDAATMYDAAADAWTIAKEPTHARRCREAGDRLRT